MINDPRRDSFEIAVEEEEEEERRGRKLWLEEA